MDEPKKILITGANGQLGLCIKDVSTKHPSLQFYFKNSTELDITKKVKIDKLFSEIKFDYCINCAAYTAVDKAESDSENAYLVNAEAVKYLAEACEKTGTTLIHISTDFVFDGAKKTPYTEVDQPNPINVYGASKVKGEKHVKEILEKYFIIRTSWVYSEHGNNFVKTMLRLANEKSEINVVNDQIGSPTYAGDLAEIIMKIISQEIKSYGTYHFSNEGVTNWFDFAKAIFEIKGVHIRVNPIASGAYPTLAIRPCSSLIDKTKIATQLNMEIPYWRIRLKDCLSKIML
tara:strand:+ start:54316 stop:55182 length:867 start_codon:yes stop_codon:yes gene_type:complete